MKFEVKRIGKSSYDEASVVITAPNMEKMISQLANFLRVGKVNFDRKKQEFEFFKDDSHIKFKFKEIPETV